MSEAGKDRYDVGGGGGAGEGGSGGGGDEEKEEGGGSGTKFRDEQKKQSGHHGCAKKGKKGALFRFRKVKKQLLRRNKRPSSASPGCLGKWGGCGGGGGGSCLCLKQPQTLGSPVESQTSDPNNPEFTFELLRALIESNDFYSEECNTHLGVDNLSPSYTHDSCN